MCKNPPSLDEKLLECRVATTHDQTMVLMSWWMRGLPQIEDSIQDLVVGLGADVKHGPAPAFGQERETADALAACLALGTGASSSTDWID